MKKRRIVITIEADSSVPVARFRKACNATVRDRYQGQIETVVIKQIHANVIRKPKAKT